MKRAFTTNRHLQVCAALIAADCSVFTMVNPQNANATWLIAGYILLGMTFFSIASLLAASFASYGERAHHATKRFLRYGAAISVALVGLQSVGQLTFKDVATLLPFIILAYLYFGYGKKLATERA